MPDFQNLAGNSDIWQPCSGPAGIFYYETSNSAGTGLMMAGLGEASDGLDDKWKSQETYSVTRSLDKRPTLNSFFNFKLWEFFGLSKIGHQWADRDSRHKQPRCQLKIRGGTKSARKLYLPRLKRKLSFDRKLFISYKTRHWCKRKRLQRSHNLTPYLFF